MKNIHKSTIYIILSFIIVIVLSILKMMFKLDIDWIWIFAIWWIPAIIIFIFNFGIHLSIIIMNVLKNLKHDRY